MSRITTHLSYANYSGAAMPAWVDKGGADAAYVALESGGGYHLSSGVKTGDVPAHATFRVNNGERDVTLDVWSKRRSADCLFAWDMRID